MSEIVAKPRVKTNVQTERPRLHKVILFNDDYTPREFVVSVLKAEFRLGEEQAQRVMLTAHRRGVCVVAVFARDVAESKAARATEAGAARGYPLRFGGRAGGIGGRLLRLRAGICDNAAMALHLVKLCVGAESIADVEDWIARRVAERVERGEAPRHAHVTRMVPKRAAELVDGGSLYWVIKGWISARQRLIAVEPFLDADGIGRCRLWLDPAVVPIRPRPMRAFQGWRYFQDRDAPPDLEAAGAGAGAMPEDLRRELGELGLL